MQRYARQWNIDALIKHSIESLFVENFTTSKLKFGKNDNTYCSPNDEKNPKKSDL